MSTYQLGRNPESLPMRPLNGGMVLNRPSQLLPGAACVDAQNYIITENGPRRRPGYGSYGGLVDSYDVDNYVDYLHIDLFAFWTSEVGALDHELMLATAGPLFKAGVSGMEEVEWRYDTGTITVAGNNVTGAATDFEDDDVHEGFILRANGGEGRISEVGGAGTITLEEGHTIADGAGLSYYIQHAFNDDPKYLCDWQVFNSEIIFTDFNAPPVCYDPSAAEGSQLDWYISDTDHMVVGDSGAEEFIARCVAVFQDRVFFGHLIEVTDGLRRQRIRWSTATNPRDFSASTAWIDLPYTQGGIVRMVVLGNMLAVYFDDAIFLGIPTNNPYLPVAFQKVDTGNIGLVGMKAIAPFVNSHFFVGQDDIYQMSSEGPRRIGAPVVSRTVRESEHLERVYVTADPSNDRVVFGFTKDTTKMEELWSFQYKSEGWSRSPITTYMVAYPLSVLSLDWSDLVGFTWDGAAAVGDSYPSWDDMRSDEGTMELFIEFNGYLRQLTRGAAYDVMPYGDGSTVNEAIEAVYETGDLDLDQPDGVKTFSRMSIKVDFSVMPIATVNFIVQGSYNRGRSWRRLGSIRIRENYDEGYVNFLLTSSHARFRLTTTEQIAPFTITEIVIKARAKGQEKSLQGQTP